MKKILVACSIFMITAGLWSSVNAQGMYEAVLFPRLGQQKTVLTADFSHSCFQDVDEQDENLAFSQYMMGMLLPLSQDEEHEFSILGGLDVMDIESAARLPLAPGRQVELPEELYDIQVGTLYRQKLDNDWIGSVLFTFGSASDQPFSSGDEMTFTGTGMLHVPAQDRDMWIFLLSFSNSRDFLPYIPLPGVEYVWNPQEDFRAIIGVPMMGFNWQPIERWHVDMHYMLINTINAEISYDLTEQVVAYAAFDWGRQGYFRADRNDEDDQLFYEEKTLAGGLRFGLTEDIILDVKAGWAFDKFFFEGEDFDDNDAARVSIDSGFFTGISAGWIF